ncbi:MAG: hypothetical protein NTZ78_06600 [Candidatus Aureabacteria bacterium]|nr:hypothetical protein [Candidatus Auribacterota bacterium]
MRHEFFSETGEEAAAENVCGEEEIVEQRKEGMDSMTEKDFWDFMNGALQGGRSMIMSAGRLDAPPEIRNAEKYLEGHGCLPEDYGNIAVQTIVEMGELLLEKKIGSNTKEVVMMILAHHGCDEAVHALKKYCRRPDKGLEYFAETALWECQMWNEDRH